MGKQKVIAKVTCERLYLTIAALTEYLGFGSEDKQKEWRDNGDLPFYQVGRQILYRKDDVDAFIERHRIVVRQHL